MVKKLVMRGLVLLMVLTIVAVPTYVGFVYVTHPASAAERINGEIIDDGSSLLGPWNGVVSTAYHEQTGVLVVPGVSSSGIGIQHVKAGLVDVGFSDVPANEPGLTSVPLLVAAVTAVYHLPGIGSLNLNGPVLASMYTGHIQFWDDRRVQVLNPHVKLPHIRVSPMERGDSSGSTYQFLAYLNKQSDTGWPLPAMMVPWPAQPNAHVVQGNDAMLNGCVSTVGCIAYIGVSYVAQAQQHGLGVARMSNGSGQFVSPTRATIKQALAEFAGHVPANGQIPMVNARHGYPIIGEEFAVIHHQTSAKEAPVEKAFLKWLVTVGASNTYTAPVEFVPLPPSVAAVSKHLIDSIARQSDLAQAA